MDRGRDHESVIAGGRYGNWRQRASQPLAAARRERQWQTSVQTLPSAFALSDPSLTAPGCSVNNRVILLVPRQSRSAQTLGDP